VGEEDLLSTIYHGKTPMKFSIVRVASHLEQGCFGTLLHDGTPFAVTLERTFDDLKPVIPAGVHHCTKTVYQKGGYETYEIHIAGHDRVLFHKGNVETDSMACVLVAESFAVIGNVAGIADSKQGFEEFMALADGIPEFDLEVKEA